MTTTTCLINQSACGRTTGDPVCPKCGMDERVVYPGQADLDQALSSAEGRYWKSEALALRAKLEQPAKPPVPRVTTPSNGRAVGQVFRDAPWAPEMVVLPSGSFLMGSPDDDPYGSPAERPQHRVEIGYQFALGKYPVTFDEWDAYAAEVEGAYKPVDQGWGRGRRPVINVSWDDAQAYVSWLNQKLGLAADDPTRYRLPSEAEWEYACRAGTTGSFGTPDGLMSDAWATYDASYTYDDAPKSGRKADRTTPVGIYPANPWGLHDMHGNVWEWVQDTYEDLFRGAPTDGSAWDTGAARRVLRGGSWGGNPQVLRSANRVGGTPGYRIINLGFRLARTVS